VSNGISGDKTAYLFTKTGLEVVHMKNILRILLTFLLCAALLAAPGAALELSDPAAPEIAAPSAVLIERETGSVLYARGETDRRPPASVTKVMTLLLVAEAVDNGTIALDDMVTGSERAASMGGSQIWLEVGEQLSVSDMIKCVAVVSANDCAVALAEHLCGSEAAFVERMNERAGELGLENTHFTNCTGLFDDTAHYTCALDIAVMSRELLSHEWIKDYTTIWMDSIRDGKSELTNTNKLVRYYEGCTGLKTGYTSTAMYCLSASAERDGTEYIAVIMHAESIESRNADASALLDYGFANYTLCPLTDGSELPQVTVELGEAESVGTVCDGGAVLLRTRDAVGITRSVELPERVAAPVQAGDVLGKLVVSNSSGPLAEVPLLASDSVERLGASGIMLQMLRSIVGLH